MAEEAGDIRIDRCTPGLTDGWTGVRTHTLRAQGRRVQRAYASTRVWTRGSACANYGASLSRGHNFTGHNCSCHRCTGHNYLCHRWVGHNCVGHAYIGVYKLRRVLPAFRRPPGACVRAPARACVRERKRGCASTCPLARARVCVHVPRACGAVRAVRCVRACARAKKKQLSRLGCRPTSSTVTTSAAPV